MTLCPRCSMKTLTRGLCRLCFDERCKVTYWDKGPACRAKGPTKAECLHLPGHDGIHEGNGYDDYGPLYRSWEDNVKRARKVAT